MFGKKIMQFGRIEFRPTTEADLNDVIKMESVPENASFVRQWSMEQHRLAIINKDVAHLIVEDANNTVMGYIILVGLENPDQNIELKRIVIKEKNRGFGKEAIQLVKKIVFEDLGAHRLWLEVMEHNGRAIRLYEFEGFTSEGVHRESLKQGKHFSSLKVMSMLAHEYDRKG